MALLINTSFHGIPLSGAYLRIMNIQQDKSTRKNIVSYSVWLNADCAEIPAVDRGKLTQAEMELEAFMALDPEATSNYEAGLSHRKERVASELTAYEIAHQPNSPALFSTSKTFPFTWTTGDIGVWGYTQLKTLPEFAGAIDV